MKRNWLFVAALLLGTACGGGGGNDNPAGPGDSPPAVSSVTVVLSSAQVVAGASTLASVELRAASGTILNGRSVAWSSSAMAVATVNDAGAIVAVSPGTTSITASSEGRSGSATLTVLPVPVATISVTGTTTISVGASSQLAAVLRAANGTELQGRSVVWGTSNTGIAAVSATGLVTGIAPGTATISANSEGRTGTLLIDVRSPVVGVTLTGASRVKVGDSYQYSATARSSDGSVVVRPVTWSTTNPGAGTFTPSGLFTPASTGTITLVATIDGVAWEAPVTAYDWQSLSGSGSLFATLPSDEQITSRSGSSEYPELTFACSSTGSFLAWVSTQSFVTENGIVAFSFDGAPSVAQTWLEFNNFRALGKTGTNASVKSFAIQMAGARLFRFAFGEFRGSTKLVSFRVTGFAPRLTPLLDACPSNNIQSAVADALTAATSTQSSMKLPSPELAQLRQERASAKASAKVPSLDAGVAASQGGEIRATRRK